MARLTTDELLAGTNLTQVITIPTSLLPAREQADELQQVTLRPLTVKDMQTVAKATREDPGMASVFMIQQALVEPPLSLAQVLKLPAGLAKYLINQINEISGLSLSADSLSEHVHAPLARAFFTLAKEFHWTPDEIMNLTGGQMLMYLQILREGGAESLQPLRTESAHER